MTIDEAIEERLKVIKVQEKLYEESYSDESKEIIKNATDNDRQLAEWLTELKDLREENKVLTSECDRLIKEKGELLSKVSGGDVLRICQLEEQLEEAKRLLKAAVEDFSEVKSYLSEPYSRLCNKWRYEDEALKLIES